MISSPILQKYLKYGDFWLLQIMIITMIFTWHMVAILIMMLGVGSFMWLRILNSSNASLPMYQMVDTNDLPSSKEIYEGNGSSKHKFTNGHLPFDKSASIQHILDSDSEEA